MAAKPMKPSAYNGKTRDARIVDAWLIRMTTYLKLTKTAEEDKIELASSYLEGDAYDWFTGNQVTLLAGTFDAFKTSFRDHFVPQNHKIVVYNEYKLSSKMNSQFPNILSRSKHLLIKFRTSFPQRLVISTLSLVFFMISGNS